MFGKEEWKKSVSNKFLTKAFSIYGIKNSLNFLSNSEITQCLTDCSLRCVPAGIEPVNWLLLFIENNPK